MQKTDIIFPKDFYLSHLTIIGGIKFTQRETELIAFFISGRISKKIAFFLSISPKTVDFHTRNITAKLGCNSREGILDFIEQSGKMSLIRKYYSIIVLYEKFQKSLKGVSTLLQNKSFSSVLIYCQQTEGDHNLPLYFKTFLELAGLKVVISLQEKHQTLAALLNALHNETHVLYLVSEAWAEELEGFLQETRVLPQPFERSLLFFLFNGDSFKKFPNEFEKLNFININKQGSYYFVVFEVLKRILNNVKIEEQIAEFRKQYNAIQEPLLLKNELIYEENNHIHTTKRFLMQKAMLFPKEMQYQLAVVLCVLGVFSIGLLGWYQYTHLNSKEYLQLKNQKAARVPIVRSDFVLPKASVLLKRSEIMDQISNQLKRQNGIQTIALVGIGGSGKTTLARQYAHQEKASVVWEMNAENHETLNSSFEKLAYALARNAEDQKILRDLQEITNSTEKEEKIIQFVKEHLKLQQKWFLIYDNVEDFVDIQKYFPQDTNTWGEGSIILTTRNTNIQNSNQINEIILIGELTPNQKLSLFLQIMHHGEKHQLITAQQKEIMGFITHLPPFPLDISVAAYYLKSTNTSFNKYLENLKNYNNEFSKMQEKFMKEAGTYLRTRYNIISLSINNLIKVNKEFKELLLFISMLDSQKIPKNLLNKYKHNMVVDDFIYNLKKYSFIVNDAENFPNSLTFSMHRSTQEITLAYLRSLLNIKEKEYFLFMIVGSIEKYINEAIETSDIARGRSLIIHLETLLKHEDLLNKKAEAIIFGILGGIYNHLGDYEKSKKLLNKSFSYFNQVENKNYIILTKLLAYLGMVHKNLGDFEQAKYFLHKSYKYAQDNLESKDTMMIIISEQLGNIYRDIGKYDQSLHFLNKSFLSCKQFLSETHVKIGGILISMGHLYIDLGDPDTALKLSTKAFDIYEKHISQDEIPFTWALHLSGSAYLELENYKEAQKALEHCLSISKKYFSDNHPNIHWIFMDLGLVYSNLGDHKKGINLLKRALKGYETCYGQNHIKTANALEKMGKAYVLQGCYHEAEKYFNKAIDILQLHQHPERYACLEGLSDLHVKKHLKEINERNKKKLKEQSRTYLIQALEILKAHFPENSPHRTRLQDKLKKFE